MPGITLIGPAGSTLAIGPTTLDAPAWVQAIGSVGALILAIWVTTEQRRQQINDEVVRDAAFAEYIERFLNDVGSTFRSIENTIEAVGSKDGIAATSASILALYKRHVIDRLEKLANMDLADWPDIEFANSFNEAYLDMNTQFVELRATANDLMKADVAEKQRRIEWARQARDRASAQASAWDADDEKLIGDDEADEVVVRTGAEPWRMPRLRQSALSDEDHDEMLDRAAHYREIEQNEALELEAYARLEWQEERGILKARLVDPLYQITETWSKGNEPLYTLIQEYKNAVPDRTMSFRIRASRRRYRPSWRLF